MARGSEGDAGWTVGRQGYEIGMSAIMRPLFLVPHQEDSLRRKRSLEASNPSCPFDGKGEALRSEITW